MASTNPDGALFTDFYELTMAAAYHHYDMRATATFSLYVRPHLRRPFWVAAGLADVLDELANYRFTPEDRRYLAETGRFQSDFIRWLADFRFSGDVWALPEGTVFFADEPIMEITAPIAEAQVIETFVLNTVGLQTMQLTKAARCVLAAEQRPLIDFALRRTQGRDAGMHFSRLACMAGFQATSNVAAARAWDLPLSGTMAHAYVQAFATEKEAFEAYAKLFPEHTILLIDTYDVLEGALLAAQIGRQMRDRGQRLAAVRLDSGDMIADSRKVRQILDNNDLTDVKIVASSGFDEYKIAETIAQKAPIDAFGVGTHAGVSADAPYLDIVYKMVHYDGRDIYKTSPGKRTLGGQKQVFRRLDENGCIQTDFIGLRTESVPRAFALLEKKMDRGKIVQAHPSMKSLSRHCRRQLSSLAVTGHPKNWSACPVTVTSALQARQPAN